MRAHCAVSRPFRRWPYILVIIIVIYICVCTRPAARRSQYTQRLLCRNLSGRRLGKYIYLSIYLYLQSCRTDIFHLFPIRCIKKINPIRFGELRRYYGDGQRFKTVYGIILQYIIYNTTINWYCIKFIVVKNAFVH